MLEGFYNDFFHQLANKHEKKYALKAFIYLDSLVAFYKLPPHIESSPSQLCEKFKTQQYVIDHLLSQFSQICMTSSGSRQWKSENNEEGSTQL